jgi:drug/metabolite transporter (DMT)-like permease
VNPKIRQTVLPLLAALIWGLAFSAQSVASEHMEALTFNAARSLLAFLALMLLDLIFSRFTPGRRCMLQLTKPEWKRLLLGGGACGAVLTLASAMQQLGITAGSSAGKAGFLTAMYIVLVPVFGLVFQRRRGAPLLWLSVALAVAGLYLLSVTESFTIAFSDLCLIACAVLFTCHILVIDRFSGELDGVQLSCIQFLVATILSAIGMLLFESPSWEAVKLCVGPILYTGLLSSAGGYTLQILAQKDANPTVVSLLMSLESLFAAVGGAVLLHQRLTGRELAGCALMLGAVVLSQVSDRPTKME